MRRAKAAEAEHQVAAALVAAPRAVLVPAVVQLVAVRLAVAAALGVVREDFRLPAVSLVARKVEDRVGAVGVAAQ